MGICIPSSWSCCEKHTNPANAQQTTWHRFGRRMVLRTPILHSPVLHPFQWALPPLSSRIGSIFPPLGSEFCCLSCFGLKMCFRTSVSALVPGFHPRWPTWADLSPQLTICQPQTYKQAQQRPEPSAKIANLRLESEGNSCYSTSHWVLGVVSVSASPWQQTPSFHGCCLSLTPSEPSDTAGLLDLLRAHLWGLLPPSRCWPRPLPPICLHPCKGEAPFIVCKGVASRLYGQLPSSLYWFPRNPQGRNFADRQEMVWREGVGHPMARRVVGQGMAVSRGSSQCNGVTTQPLMCLGSPGQGTGLTRPGTGWDKAAGLKGR